MDRGDIPALVVGAICPRYAPGQSIVVSTSATAAAQDNVCLSLWVPILSYEDKIATFVTLLDEQTKKIYKKKIDVSWVYNRLKVVSLNACKY